MTVTFVNVFGVDRDRQQELLDLLEEGAALMRDRPGFVSLRLLASVDGERVLNIAEWTGAEAVKATQADPEAAAFAERAAAVATPLPGLYRVVAEHRAEATPVADRPRGSR
jgi:quinol monooxygenase YgiN